MQVALPRGERVLGVLGISIADSGRKIVNLKKIKSSCNAGPCCVLNWLSEAGCGRRRGRMPPTLHYTVTIPANNEEHA